MRKELLRLALVLLALIALPAMAQQPDEEGQQPDADIAGAEYAQENNVPRLLIVEVQTGSKDSATEEFVEIFNPSDNLLSLAGIKLQYRSASGDDWLTRANLTGMAAPRARYLISGYDGEENANLSTRLSLAAAGGHLRLMFAGGDDGNTEITLDQLAWGIAEFPLVEGQVAPAPAPGQSLKRRLDEDGTFIDSGADALDFMLSDSPTPFGLMPPPPPDPEPELPTGEQTEERASFPDENVQAAQDNLWSRRTDYPQLNITELFVDPKSPLTDAKDEFIELFNPNSGAVDLDGYVIETGNKYNYRYALPNITLAPKSYVAFFSVDSGLVLANSGGRARLLNGLGDVVYETPEYAKAKAGDSWALISGFWQWTSKPTPGAANSLTASVSRVSSSVRRNKSVAGSRRYNNTAKVLASLDQERNVYTEPPALEKEPVDKTVVASVGSMALLYAMYEYRYDISNRIEQLRRYYRRRRGRRP